MKYTLPLFFIFSCSLFSMGQNVRVDGVVQSRNGMPAAGALVAVCSQPATLSPPPCTPLVALCSSLSDVTCTSPNPVTADGLGNYFFYLKPGGAPITYQFYGSGLTAKALPDQSPGASAVSGAVVLSPGADQTILGSHQLINRGTSQTGPALSSFDANIQAQAFDPASGEVAVSGQSNIPSPSTGFQTGIQGLAQGQGALGVWGVASHTTNGVNDSPGGGGFQAFLTTSANNTGGPFGASSAGGGFPAVGTTLGFAEGYYAYAGNGGAGTVTTVRGYDALGNYNTGGGTIINNYGFDAGVAQTVGQTNAAFHSVDQGSGASNYGILLDGVTHNKLGSGATQAGWLLGNLGTAQSCGNIAFTGWGAGATCTPISGYSSRPQFTITAGAAPSLNPTIVETFADASPATPNCTIWQVGGTGIVADLTNGTSSTTISGTLTWLQTPTNTATYIFTVDCRL